MNKKCERVLTRISITIVIAGILLIMLAWVMFMVNTPLWAGEPVHSPINQNKATITDSTHTDWVDLEAYNYPRTLDIEFVLYSLTANESLVVKVESSNQDNADDRDDNSWAVGYFRNLSSTTDADSFLTQTGSFWFTCPLEGIYQTGDSTWIYRIRTPIGKYWRLWLDATDNAAVYSYGISWIARD